MEHIYAYLKDRTNKALSGKKITIKFDGKTYTSKTDSKGCVKLNVEKTPGTYNIKFSFDASGYKSSSASAKVTVKPIPTIITANNLVFTYKNSNNKLNAYLKDNKGKALSNKVIVFNFDGKNYKLTTNSQGLATLTIDALPKTYSATISFRASNYVASTKKVTVTVNPIPISLQVNNLTCTYNGHNQISAFLKSNNNPMSNENVVLNINGHNYNGKTDSKGQISFSFNEEPKLYQANVSFSKIGYASCSKQVSILIKPMPVTLYVDDLICECNKNNHLTAYLKTNGTPLSNQEISFSINNYVHKSKTDSDGKVSYALNLNPGEYKCKVSFSNKYYQSVSKTVNLKVYYKLNNFEYSFSIPNYVNLTNSWRLVSGYLKPEYIASYGAGGKVKMPVNREYIIVTGNKEYDYDSNDFKSENILLKIDDLSNLRITSNSDYTKFTYSGVVYDDVDQISAVYRQKEYYGMLYPDYEELLIVVNSITKLSIGFSNPVGWDETGVRFAFINNDLGHHQDVMSCRYSKFPNYQLLRFAETGESVKYTRNMLKISNFPTKEKITTEFKIGGTSIIKDEWVSFGKHYNKENSFEVVQSYAITSKPLTKELFDFWLELNQGYRSGAMRACYGTFLTALNTIKLYDEYLMNICNLYDVTPTKKGVSVSMCGVEYGGTAYVHTPDPTMNYNLNGDIKNAFICRYFSSLFLGEFESYSLNCADIESTSSLDSVFSNILNNNFSISTQGKYTIFQSNNDSEHQLKFNLDNGLMYDLTINDSFVYKGAISCYPDNYCFHDYLTNKLIYNIQNKDSEAIKLSDRDIEFLEDALGDLSLASAAVMIPCIVAYVALLPFSVTITLSIVAIALIVGGVALKTRANGGNFNKGVGDSITSFVLDNA